jgi:tRNA modification GTPase
MASAERFGRDPDPRIGRDPDRVGRDTIAAIATAAGRGGIGIVRVSGAAVPAIARALAGSLPAPRQAQRARFRDAHGAAIDEGLVLYFPAPHSYTAEAVLELHGHGGTVVMQALLRACLDAGARLAEPGEFTRRAFLEGKLDLAQAEAVADLIEASSEQAARAALRSLSGEFSAAIHALASRLVELRALTEAMLDFPEEELDAVHRHRRRVAPPGARSGPGRGARQEPRGQPSCAAASTSCWRGGSQRRQSRACSTASPAKSARSSRRSPHDARWRCATDPDRGRAAHAGRSAGLRESVDEPERLGVERTRRELRAGRSRRSRGGSGWTAAAATPDRNAGRTDRGL